MGTSFLDRGTGRIAYEVTGSGPLVVALHGMGDRRQTWRFVEPMVTGAGFRFAALDIRGHGESDDTFDRFDDVALADDAIALVEALGGGPAVLVGNSMGAGAAVIAAARRPELVAGLALFGAFVRDPKGSAVMRPLLHAAMVRPWGPAVWKSYYRSLFPGAVPADFAETTAAVQAELERRWPAFVKTTGTTHEPARLALPGVHVPAVVVMGAKDRDFSDPAAEARFAADSLGGDAAGAQAVVVPDSGHYPMVDSPEAIEAPLLALVERSFRA